MQHRLYTWLWTWQVASILSKLNYMSVTPLCLSGGFSVWPNSKMHQAHYCVSSGYSLDTAQRCTNHTTLCSDHIAPLITHLFQQSYSTGKLPPDWSNAFVTSIFKKWDKSDSGNYRPISLTCILCKVMEHVVLSLLWRHLHQLKIILTFQHCFQSGLSCETQLIQAIQDEQIHRW